MKLEIYELHELLSLELDRFDNSTECFKNEWQEGQDEDGDFITASLVFKFNKADKLITIEDLFCDFEPVTMDAAEFWALLEKISKKYQKNDQLF